MDVAVRSGLELDASTGGIAVNQQLEVITEQLGWMEGQGRCYLDRPCLCLIGSLIGSSLARQHHHDTHHQAIGNVFVAGGVASYYDAALGRRRVEMFDHSIKCVCQSIDLHVLGVINGTRGTVRIDAHHNTDTD